MNKSIDKFVNFIIEYQYKLKEDIKSKQFTKEELICQIPKLRSELIISYNLITILLSAKNKSYDLFNDFETLSNFLLKANLTKRDYTNIIFYIIESNIKKSLIEDSVIIINELELQKHFENTNLEKIIRTNEYRQLFTRKEEELNEEERKNKLVIENYIKNNFVNFVNNDESVLNLIKNTKIIDKHYFQKKDSYNLEDIELIAEALIKMHVSSTICIQIVLFLQSEYKKRINKQTKKNISFPKYENQQEKLLSRKEYHQILEELNQYFDFKNMRSIRSLTLKEQIYIVSLLLKIKTSMNEIQEFLRISKIENNRYSKHPIIFYLENYEKLKFYEETACIKKEINTLESYFQETFLANKEDYIFWLNCLKEELYNTLRLIPKDNAYEIEQAKKLLTKK